LCREGQNSRPDVRLHAIDYNSFRLTEIKRLVACVVLPAVKVIIFEFWFVFNYLNELKFITFLINESGGFVSLIRVDQAGPLV
jgi:hypothetical protein